MCWDFFSGIIALLTILGNGGMLLVLAVDGKLRHLLTQTEIHGELNKCDVSMYSATGTC